MTRRNLLRGLLALIILSLPVLVAALSSPTVLAHGSMQNPISRYYACYLEGPETPDTLACRDAIAAGGTQPLYDWNEVNISNAGGRHREIIPDGKLCSAGRTKYAPYDQPRSDWATTIMPTSGNYTFVYNAYVPHNQGIFEFYVTRNGWDPNQPLKWSDLEPFYSVEFPPLVNGTYVMTGPLPQGKSGRHIIYNIWQRYDSQEAFYSCSDVWFGSSPTPTPTALPGCTAPAWSATQGYLTGDVVAYGGREWRAKWGNSGSTPSSDGQGNPWEILRYCQPGGNTPVPTATPIRTTVPTATPIRTTVPTATPIRTTVPTATPVRTTVPTATPIRTTVPTATPTQGTGGSCQVTYTIASQWGTGFNVDVTIRSSSAVSGWTLAWAFGGNQQITNAWNATPSQSGANVSARNAAHNSTIAAGGTTSFGFQGTYSGTNAKPTAFTLNGAACTVTP